MHERQPRGNDTTREVTRVIHEVHRHGRPAIGHHDRARAGAAGGNHPDQPVDAQPIRGDIGIPDPPQLGRGAHVPRGEAESPLREIVQSTLETPPAYIGDPDRPQRAQVPPGLLEQRGQVGPDPADRLPGGQMTVAPGGPFDAAVARVDEQYHDENLRLTSPECRRRSVPPTSSRSAPSVVTPMAIPWAAPEGRCTSTSR
ncbi:MAG: hypothetical protein HONDAALG_02426 [Gammaproteobacteria bacterium]|nr:hypothetical protein [Gammaproteobacteria bacterium]